MGKAASALAVRRWRPAPVPVAIQASWAADFGLAVNPEQIVAHRAWRVARACAMATIEAGSGLVVVLGGPGTGKSLLLREIARQLESKGKAVRLVQRGDLVGDPVKSGVELVDEADHIDPATLGRLVAARDAVHVLAALPRFAEQLAGFGTPMTVVALAPLTAQGIDDFVTQRLATAGRSVDLMSRPAMAMLVEHSGGIPRVINMLVGAAISLAAADGAQQIGADHVEQAVTLRDGFAPRPMATVTALPIVASSAPAPAANEAGPVVDLTPPPPPERNLSLLPASVAAVALFGTLFAGLALHANYYPTRATVISQAANNPADPPAVALIAQAEPATPIAPAAAVTPAEWSLASAPELEALAAIEPAAGAALAETSPPEQPAATEAIQVAVASMPPAPVVAAPPAAKPEPPVQAAVQVVLPATPAVRVRIQYARADADATARANRHAASLRAQGFLVDAPSPLARGAQPGIRYFFAEDRDAAAEVARRLESFAGDIRLAAPAKREAVPRPGTVEVLLPAR